MLFEQQPGHGRVAALNRVHEGCAPAPVRTVGFVRAPATRTQSGRSDGSPPHTQATETGARSPAPKLSPSSDFLTLLVRILSPS